MYIWRSSPATVSSNHSGFLHFIFSLSSTLCVITPWGQENGSRMCEVPVREFNYLYPIFHFSFLYSAWPPYAAVLICPSMIVHSPQNTGYMWGCAAYSTKRQPLNGIIMQKMDVAKLYSCISHPWFYWCLRLIVYCLQKQDWWFRHDVHISIPETPFKERDSYYISATTVRWPLRHPLHMHCKKWCTCWVTQKQLKESMWRKKQKTLPLPLLIYSLRISSVFLSQIWS